MGALPDSSLYVVNQVENYPWYLAVGFFPESKLHINPLSEILRFRFRINLGLGKPLWRLYEKTVVFLCNGNHNIKISKLILANVSIIDCWVYFYDA